MNDRTQHNQPGLSSGASVLDLVRTQRELYQGLHRLAQRQRRLIADDDPSALLSLLSQRQKLTQSLVELGSRLAPYRLDWPATCQALDEGQRREVQGMLDEVSDLLGRIIAADEEDARLLTARKAKVAAELKTHQGDRRAVAAYAATRGTTGQASRFDRISEES